MVTDKEKSACTGCTACVNVCPTKCISMKADDQGFLYPYIDKELCIGCRACDHVCESAAKALTPTEVCKGYGVFAKDKELQLHSSSGGVFSLLCNEVLSQGGAIVGVALSEDNRLALHKVIDNKEGLPQFRGAKYIQSEVGDSFQKVKSMLNEGKTVLFSGTPCQVDGLKAFIGNNEEKLLCIDMVCHGTPSALVWRKYCDETENKYKGKISSVNFRNKKYSWEKPSADHSASSKVVYRSKNEDPYMRLFLGDYTLRPSCYECPHKGIDRKSDITIADFWGVDKINPGFSNGAGASLVTIHTEKGNRYFEKIRKHLVIQEVEPLKAYKYNGSALKPATRPENADEFWKELDHDSIENLANKYAPYSNSLKTIIKKSQIYGLANKNKKINMENGICFVIDR